MPQPLHTKKDDDTTSLLLCPLREGATEHNQAARAHRANTITTRVSPPHSTVPRATTMTIFSSCCTFLFATVSAQVPTMYPSHWSMRTDETKEQIKKKSHPTAQLLATGFADSERKKASSPTVSAGSVIVEQIFSRSFSMIAFKQHNSDVCFPFFRSQFSCHIGWHSCISRVKLSCVIKSVKMQPRMIGTCLTN